MISSSTAAAAAVAATIKAHTPRSFPPTVRPLPHPSFLAAPLGRLVPLSLRVRRANEARQDSPRLSVTRSGEEEARCAEPTVRLVAVVGFGSVSPLKGAPWEEVMLHIADKLRWVDDGYEMMVFSDKSLQTNGQHNEGLRKELARADLLVVVSIHHQHSVDWLQRNGSLIANIFCFDSSPSLKSKLGGSYVDTEVEGNFFSKAVGMAAGTKRTDSTDIVKTVSDAWNRHNSDDIKFCLLVIINAHIKPVPTLKNLRAKGFSTLNCMVRNCGTQVLNCLLDPNCRKALQCLNSCSPTDQVCSYRCISSYESPHLEAFSLCVLEKHNCLDLNAEIPEKPHVRPLTHFRSENLTHELAEDLFVGWLGTLDWSWRVIAGQNPAYDQFPCQYQLFYRGKGRGSLWYEPIFQVRKLDGKLVWRRRRYRVRRGADPGTFFFSVLDNGVVSKESWTIVDVADDLSWGLFHYHGAAKAAGQSYTGAVLVSPDGNYPQDIGGLQLASALEKCKIKSWELYDVNNSNCQGPPLGVPDGSSFHSMLKLTH